MPKASIVKNLDQAKGQNVSTQKVEDTTLGKPQKVKSIALADLPPTTTSISNVPIADKTKYSIIIIAIFIIALVLINKFF